MTQDSFPIIPPPELVQQWLTEGHHQDYCTAAEHAVSQAARWGADMELEACINYFLEYDPSWGENSELLTGLRAARRPKPPSLKERAMQAMDRVDVIWATDEFGKETMDDINAIRRALESLPD